MSGLDPFFSLAGKSASAGILNEPAFIEVIRRVYRCEPRHQVGEAGGQAIGVPMFAVSKPLVEKKIVSMPFNFYPKLVGAADPQAALKMMIDEARRLGPSAKMVWKTDHVLSESVLRGHGVRSTVNSIESRMSLAGFLADQQKLYQTRLLEKIRKARRDLQNGAYRLEVFEDARRARAFYELLVGQYRQKHRMLPQPWALYESLFEARIGRGFVRGFGLFQDERMLSGIVVLGDTEEWKYCWGATDGRCEIANASALLIDEAVAGAIRAGAKVFNLGSSSPTDGNLRSFKSHWGSSETPIHSYYWNCAPRSLDLHSGFSFPRWIIHHTPEPILETVSRIAVPWLA